VNPDLKKIKSQEDYDKYLEENDHFKLFINFLQEYKKLFVANVYADSPFEASYPYLWSFYSLLEVFRNENYVFRNMNVFEPTEILKYADFYSETIFEILISNFKCQWDIIRKHSFKILKIFPSDLKYFTKEYLEIKLLAPCKNLLTSPIIKDVEAATYSYGMVFELE
jgi:Putative death-receptor fusion protein (DUF2428)